MKRRGIKGLGIRFIGISGFLVIILVVLISPGNSFIFTGVINDGFISNICDDPVLCFDSIRSDVSSQSIIDLPKMTESDDSLITQFLDSSNISSPLSTEKFALETQTALFDSDQNQFNNSTVFGIPQLSVTDEYGRLLDLGKIQTSFLGVMPNVEKSINVWGNVSFYLDDHLIGGKQMYLWSSSSNTNKAELSVVSNLLFDENKKPINPVFSDRKTNFTFTLSDEGRYWVDGDIHYYRIVVTELNAIIQSDGKIKSFSRTGEIIVYELKVRVDGTKKVVLNEDNEVVNVFKSDDTFSVNSSTQIYRRLISGGVNEELISSRNPQLPVSFNVYVKDTNKLLGIVDNTSFNENRIEERLCVERCYVEVSVFPQWKNPVISNIPRSTDLLIKSSDGKITEYRTPLSQKNLFITCDADKKCISNFGYSFP